jgi:hypothetical protein
VYETDRFMPPQAPPIDRTPAGVAAFRSEAGVNASQDDLFDFDEADLL